MEERTFVEGPMASTSKESELICMVDKVNKGKSSNGGGDAATGGPPSVVTTGAGNAPDNSPEP